MVLHPFEHDQPAARGFDLVRERVEDRAQAQVLDLVLHKAAGGLLEAALRLTDADHTKPRLARCPDHAQLCEEMRLGPAPSAMDALVARRLQKRPKLFGDLRSCCQSV